MPVNRNALLRYKTLDKCLQNRFRKWTLEDLIDACSDALYEYEGIDKGVSKRTVQADLQMMRSDKLGYNAPIIVKERKYYTYEDQNYSITNIPLSNQDLNQLSEAVDFLKQFKGFSHFSELEGMVQKLEDQVFARKTNRAPVIDFEKNENLKGLEFLDTLYQTIINKKTIEITYQSFSARAPQDFIFHPYLLKEYRNRWFVLGIKGASKGILTLALDRIVKTENSSNLLIPNNFNAKEYFSNVVGVTVNPNDDNKEIIIFIERNTAPYILTKPIHHSQQIVERDVYGVTISLSIQPNFELERVLLGYGDKLKVLAPERLKRRIKTILNHAANLYDTEVTNRSLKHLYQKVNARGNEYFRYCFTKKALKNLHTQLFLYFKEKEVLPIDEFQACFDLNKKIKEFIFNKNFTKILKHLNIDQTHLISIQYNSMNEDEKLKQTTKLYLTEKRKLKGKWEKKGKLYKYTPATEILQSMFCVYILLSDPTKVPVLKMIAGSHQEKMEKEKLTFIKRNTIPRSIDIELGSLFITKPLLIRDFIKTKTKKQLYYLQLNFGVVE